MFKKSWQLKVIYDDKVCNGLPQLQTVTEVLYNKDNALQSLNEKRRLKKFLLL